ncbi:S8 family serine peptidase [bacterium]|uniref:S8 family serine peptidase n=1 Tax=Agathobacter rectalis TaxID=39491 RepID=UPI0027D23BE1|nr:S8 family serine peptidase [Agathobacter rectalis]MCB6950238.1 S8 family serine peptidase [Agathobacter rectalis]MCI6044564.1 S8 family serine peptidase [bacterium]MDY3022554.1 S8 family serine peptidase [Oliverpabstia sp.]MDY3999605.1 S8 family serine peptidase [Blautia sp.]
MIDVAIIDSGIHMTDTDICSMVSKGFSIDYSDGNTVYQNEYNDLNGHGTYCASIIRRFCPDVKLTIIKILDQCKMGRSECLIEALHYLYHNPVDVISMSLSTQDNQYEKELGIICKKIEESGMIMVSSLANHAEISYPAVYEGVIGVKGALFLEEKEYIYHPDRVIQCQGSSIPVLVEGVDGTYTFFGGNSKAAANISGIIASLLQKFGMTDDFGALFKEYSCHTKKNEQTITISSIINSNVTISGELCEEKDFKKLITIMQNVLEIPMRKSQLIFECSILHPELNIDKKNFGKLIKEIEREWKIHFRKEEVNLLSIRDITTIYSLLKRTEKYESNQK